MPCTFEVSGGTGRIRIPCYATFENSIIHMTPPSIPSPTIPPDMIDAYDLPIEDPLEEPGIYPPYGEVVTRGGAAIGTFPTGGSFNQRINLSTPDFLPSSGEPNYQFRIRFRIQDNLPDPQAYAYTVLPYNESGLFHYVYRRALSAEAGTAHDFVQAAFSIDFATVLIKRDSTGSTLRLFTDELNEVLVNGNLIYGEYYILVLDVIHSNMRVKFFRQAITEPEGWLAHLTIEDAMPVFLTVRFAAQYAAVPSVDAVLEIGDITYWDPLTSGGQPMTDVVTTIGRVTQNFENPNAGALNLTGPYVPGSVQVSIDGLLQIPGQDYTESNPGLGEITLGEDVTGIVSVTYETAPGVSPTPSGPLVQIGPGDSLQNAINNPATAVVELLNGTYDTGFVQFPNRSVSNPLLVRAQNQHLAIIRGQWAFGGGTDFDPPSSYVTCDGMSFQGNSVADTAILYFGYGPSNNITLRNIDMRGNTNTVAPQQSHHIYLSRGSHQNILIENYTVVGPGGAMTGFHGFHNEDGPRQNITLRNFNFSNLYCGILVWQTVSGLLIEDGYISNSSQGVDISNSPTGTIRRVRAVNAGGNTIGSGMVQQDNDL